MSTRPLPQSDWRELVLWLLRRRRRYRVTEGSMLPTLPPGVEILLDPRAYRDQPPAPGDIVVAYHPERPHFKLIKRVRDLDDYGRVFLQGDNLADSTDSRQFGALPPDRLIGKVTSIFG